MALIEDDSGLSSVLVGLIEGRGRRHRLTDDLVRLRGFGFDFGHDLVWGTTSRFGSLLRLTSEARLPFGSARWGRLGQEGIRLRHGPLLRLRAFWLLHLTLAQLCRAVVVSSPEVANRRH